MSIIATAMIILALFVFTYLCSEYFIGFSMLREPGTWLTVPTCTHLLAGKGTLATFCHPRLEPALSFASRLLRFPMAEGMFSDVSALHKFRHLS